MSPRATLSLLRVARARAASQGRGYVVPDDVKALAEPALAHRLILQPEARLQNVSVDELLTDILDNTPVPVLEGRAKTAPGSAED